MFMVLTRIEELQGAINAYLFAITFGIEIVTDIFSPKKITCIKKSKKYDEISCKIYTEWETTDDDGKLILEIIPDEITLKNPFDYEQNALHAQFQINGEDYKKLKQFCFAKGIYGASIEWLLNNPYMEKSEISFK